MRVLVVVPPFAGHVNPVIGVAAELGARGHRVAWAGDAALLGALLPAGSTVHPCAGLDVARPAGLRGFAALKHLWEQVLLPLADVMAPGVEAALAAERPDVVLVDQQAFAGAFAAERWGLPWVTSATTSSELVDPLAGMPAVAGWIRERLGERSAVDPRFSPLLTLAFTAPALAPAAAAPTVRFVGHTARPSEPHPFDFALLDPDRPLVYVSLGTVNADTGARFLTECATALARRPHLQAVIADPAGAVTAARPHLAFDAAHIVAGSPQPGLAPEPAVDAPLIVAASSPPQPGLAPEPAVDAPLIVTAPRVPQLALLDRASVVVCHGGHNTVCEALARGVPLVVAPIRDDQPVIAEQVTAAGAGIRLRFTHAAAEHIGAAIDRLIADPAYRAAAARVRDSFAAAGGAAAAADALEALV
ncbi:glycosyltransferase [Actinokineospora sp. NPDC004072]